MKKFLLLFLSIWIAFACSEDKEIPNPNSPIEKPGQNESPKPVGVDSVYYQLDVDGFELVAATEDSTSLFLQTDTTFAFKCLFDSCGTNRLIAYCDSIGLVERIVADNQVVNILHHEDKKKMDIFYKDVEGKLAWIKDVDSPYKDLSSRSEAGDVPYSAISIVSDLSYAVYTIINTCDIYKVAQPEKYKFINKSSRKETYNMSGTIALKLIMQVLGKEYKMSVSNHISTIVTVMSDYANWVQQELYGDAIPVLRTYATRFAPNQLKLATYVTDVNPEKNEFKVGVMYTEDGKKLNAYKFYGKMDAEYNPQHINYLFSFPGLATGKKYKFRPYLAPVSTSKYMTGLKSLLDYYRMNYSFDYRLLETKAQFISQEDDYATIKLSVENADISIKMGVIYSEHSDLLEHEYEKIEYEPSFGEGQFSNDFEKEVKLNKSKSGYTYYMPYIIYHDDIIKREIYYTDTIYSATLTEGNFLFYGKKDSIVNNPITGDAKLTENTLNFKGRFYIEQEKNIVEYGICYSKDDKEITTENSSVLKAKAHQEGNFEVSVNVTDKDNTFYYRAYIKVNDKYYYGKIEKYERYEIKIYELIKTTWTETTLNEKTGEYEVTDVYSYQDINGMGLFVIRGAGNDKLYRGNKWCLIDYGKREGDKGETYDFDKEKATENEFVLYQKHEDKNTNVISHAYYCFERVIDDRLTEEEVIYVLTHSSGRDLEDILEGM